MAKTLSEECQWVQRSPRCALEWFDGARFRWWIAGGWAIDLFLGAQSRDHSDIDIGVLRNEVPAVAAYLSEWEIFEASKDVLTAYKSGTTPSNGVNSLWCRSSSTGPWELELLLDDAEGDYWCYRRDRRVRRPLSEMIWRHADGMSVLVPAIQLLYKAKAARPSDLCDFAAVHPRLAASELEWLRESLETAHPAHPWIDHMGDRGAA